MLGLPSHFDVLLSQGFEGVSFTNSPEDSIHDWWTCHEDAGGNTPGSVLVSRWLDIICLPEFGEAHFTHWPRANVRSPHLQYVPRWALGLHDSSRYVVTRFVRLSSVCPLAWQRTSSEALPNPYTNSRGILPIWFW